MEITVTKKNSDIIVTCIFLDDDGVLKAIVDDDYEIGFKENSSEDEPTN